MVGFLIRDQNKVGYNISKYMWTVNRKNIIHLISGVVVKKVMVSINIAKPAILANQIQRL